MPPIHAEYAGPHGLGMVPLQSRAPACGRPTVASALHMLTCFSLQSFLLAGGGTAAVCMGTLTLAFGPM